MSMVGFGANDGRVYERRALPVYQAGGSLAHAHRVVRIRASATGLRYACIVIGESGMIRAPHGTFWSFHASLESLRRSVPRSRHV